MEALYQTIIFPELSSRFSLFQCYGKSWDKNYIANLGGRRTYEEKRAAKLGFSNLYDYLEYKFSKKAEVLVEQESKLSELKAQRAIPKTPKQSQNKSCGCC